MCPTDIVTIDELLSMNKKQLEEAGYERTRFWVKKIVVWVMNNIDKPAQLDLSPNSILRRECKSARIEDINAHFGLWEHSLVTIDKIHKEEAILFNKNATDCIFISWTDAHGNRLEIIFHVRYHLKNDEIIDAFHWRYKTDVVSTNLSCSKVTVHKKITKSRMAKICNDKRPTQKLIQECLKNEITNGSVFEYNGAYYWNGSKNNL